MLQQHVPFLIFSLFFVLSVSGTNSNIYFRCSQLNFDLSTPYEFNVNSLFSSIVDSAAVYNFNTFEVSLPGNSQSSVVYGLFQCQDDLNFKCKECVTNSVRQLKSICPVSIGATIQLEGCLLQYNNVSFFGVEDKTEMRKKCGPSIGSNLDVLNSIDTTLANLIAGDGQYFRNGDFGSIHGVAQCVQDLSVNDCQDCLSEASGRLRSECERSSWGEIFLGKCYIRYTGNSNGKNSSDSHNGDELRTSIIVQVIGNAIGGVVTAVVSYFISSRVAEAKVEPVKRDTVYAKRDAEDAKRDAGEAKRDAGDAKRVAGDAIREAKAASDIASRASYQGSIQSHRTRF